MTDRFVETARQMAVAQGLGDYPFVVIEHPIAGASDEELRAQAERALPGIVSLLTTGGRASRLAGGRASRPAGGRAPRLSGSSRG